MFRSDLLPQVYEIKHLAMQLSFTNTCQFEELGDFKCGSVLGCHLFNKSVCKIASLLDIQTSNIRKVEVFMNKSNSNTKQKTR